MMGELFDDNMNRHDDCECKVSGMLFVVRVIRIGGYPLMQPFTTLVRQMYREKSQ